MGGTAAGGGEERALRFLHQNYRHPLTTGAKHREEGGLGWDWVVVVV